MAGAGGRGPPTEPIAGAGAGAAATVPIAGAGAAAGAAEPTVPIAGAGAAATVPIVGAGTVAGATEPAAAGAQRGDGTVVTSRSGGDCDSAGAESPAAGSPELVTSRSVPAAGTGGTGATADAGAGAGAIGDVMLRRYCEALTFREARKATRRVSGRATDTGCQQLGATGGAGVRLPRPSRAVPGSRVRPPLEQPCAA